MKINYTKFDHDYTGMYVAVHLDNTHPPDFVNSLYIGIVEVNHSDKVQIDIKLIYFNQKVHVVRGKTTRPKYTIKEISMLQYLELERYALLGRQIQIDVI